MDHVDDAEFQEVNAVEERRRVVGAFISDELRIGHRVLEEHKEQVEAFRDFEARPYQQDAWDAIWQARERGETRGLIHLATGLGKTSIAVVDYAKFVKEREEKGAPKPRALFIVHQDTILEQANERFHQMLPGINTQFFKTKQAALPDADVTFATFQSLSRETHRFSRDYFDYIIYDEAHHTKAKTYERVVEHFEPQFELAMTATPDRMDERDITDHFGEPLYVKTLAEAMTEGYLADVEYTIVGDDAIREAIANGFEAKSVRDLQKLLSLDMRNEEIVSRIEAKKAEIRKREGIEVVKTAIYTDSIEYADYIASFMNTAAYHSSMSKQTQKEVLRKFRSDESEDIVVKDMINEGVDVPDIRLIIFLRSTQSRAIFEQQLGRGLRLWPGKTRAYVMDFVANIERIEFIQDIAEKYNFYAFGRGGSMRRGDQGPKSVTINPSSDQEVDEVSRSTFEFSEEIVDILDKYNFLRFEVAPDGYVSIPNAARAIGLTNVTLQRQAIAMGIDIKKYLGRNGHPTGHITMDALELIRGMRGEMAASGLFSYEDVADEFGVTKQTISAWVVQFNLAPQKIQIYNGGQASPLLTSSDIETIRSFVAPKGYLKFEAAARALGIGRNTLILQAERLGIQAQQYKGAQGPDALYLSPEDFIKIENQYTLPDGWVSLKELAQERKVTMAHLHELASSYGITVKVVWSKGKGRPISYVSPSDVSKL